MARVAIIDPAALADAAAERLAEQIDHAIAIYGAATVSLTGGSTPRAMYEALADGSRRWRDRIDWARVHLYWGDERHVPPDHADSNFGMAFRALVQHVPIPPGHVHRMRGELPEPKLAAAEYEQQLPEVFDVMLLGLGDDGHIASIFPGSPLLDAWRSRSGAGATATATEPARSPRVAALSTSKGWRITLTPQPILASREIVMLVAGENKAAAVAAALEGPLDVNSCPAQLLREAGERVEWMIDTAAGERLRSR